MRESWTDERLDEFAKRIDERFDRIDERFEAVQGEMKQRFEQVDKRFDKIDERLESMQKAMSFGVIAISSSFIAGFAALVTQV